MRPRRSDFPTWWSWRQADKAWRGRTGGSLLGTLLLCLVIGIVSGSGVVLVVLVVGGLGLHLAVRSGLGRDKALESEADRLEEEILRARRDGTAPVGKLLHAEAVLREQRPGSRVFR